MASKKTVTPANLEALGAARLAALLVDLSGGDAALKRRLRMELAAAESPDSLAKEIRKRLITIGKSRTFIEDGKGYRALRDDLRTQRKLIAEQIAPRDPQQAMELLWRLLDLAQSVYERCDDSNGEIGAVFNDCCAAIGAAAQNAGPDPVSLADRVYDAVTTNDYAQYDGLLQAMGPALGADGLGRLKTRLVALSQQKVVRPAAKDRRQIGWSNSGPLYEDELFEYQRRSVVSLILSQIADMLGDVDAFIAQHDDEARTTPRIAAQIARRLLAAGRPEEALAALDAAPRKPLSLDFAMLVEMAGLISATDEEEEPDDARIAVLDALGRAEEAQAERWACFAATLSRRHLVDYLARLSDADALDAEERAFAHAAGFELREWALRFLLAWPAPDRAAALVMAAPDRWDGNRYDILTPAAKALAHHHPLAASVLLRAMADWTLGRARASRYKHAARHLETCAALAAEIDDFGPIPPHDDYMRALRAAHGRKSIWSLMAA